MKQNNSYKNFLTEKKFNFNELTDGEHNFLNHYFYKESLKFEDKFNDWFYDKEISIGYMKSVMNVNIDSLIEFRFFMDLIREHSMETYLWMLCCYGIHPNKFNVNEVIESYNCLIED